MRDVRGGASDIYQTSPTNSPVNRRSTALGVALTQFRQLLSTATPAGQLYGLLGLRLRGKRAFEAAAPRYLASHTEVSTMEGCSAGTAQTKDIARKISTGYFK